MVILSASLALLFSATDPTSVGMFVDKPDKPRSLLQSSSPLTIARELPRLTILELNITLSPISMGV